MSVKLSDLAAWIDKALTRKPSPRLAEICGDYYSPYYMFLGHAAHMLRQDGIAVELGTEGGRGLAAMSIDAVTPFGSSLVIGVDHTKSAELVKVLDEFDNILFLHQDSLPLPAYFADGPKIALLHIDTEHSYSMAKAEFEAYRPLLTSPAVVVFDDLHAQDDDVLKYFVSLPYPKIIDDRLHPSCGWGVLLYQEFDYV